MAGQGVARPGNGGTAGGKASAKPGRARGTGTLAPIVAGPSQISTRTIVRVFFTLVALGVLLYVLYLIRWVIGLLLIAGFLAVALGPAVDHALRLRLPRPAAILLVFLCLFLAIFAVGSVVVPPIVDEVQSFADNVPDYIQDARENPTLRRYDDKYDITAKLEDQAANLPSRLGDAAGALQSVTVGVFSTLIQLLTVLTIAFFLLLDGGRIVNFGLAQMRPDHEDRYRAIAADVYRSTGGYVAGALGLATACGLSTYLVLTLLGVDFAVPLAVLMAFLALIPLVGATIGGVLVGAVTVFHDFPTDTIVWFVFIVAYQQFENNVLQPFVYRRAVDLHPLAIITAILVGSSLLGVLGALVAIPIAAALQIVVRDVWTNRRSTLVDPSGTPLSPPAPAEPPPREVLTQASAQTKT